MSSFARRFTSRPFLLALLDFFKNGGAVYLLMNPNFPADKVNALVGLASCGTFAIAAFIGFELNKDATAIKAQSTVPEEIKAGGNVTMNTTSNTSENPFAVPPEIEWQEGMPPTGYQKQPEVDELQDFDTSPTDPEILGVPESDEKLIEATVRRVVAELKSE